MGDRMWCLVGLWLVAAGCASDWKIHGGPKECVRMCQAWNMELTGMVGVGNQDRTGPGATACVCEVPKPAATSGGEEVPVGAVGTSTSSAAVIVALQEAQRQAQQQQQSSQVAR